jgi:hypothetical protein
MALALLPELLRWPMRGNRKIRVFFDIQNEPGVKKLRGL